MLVSWNCMRSLSPIAIICVDLRHQWHLSISNIFDACVCNLGLPILSSVSSLLTFSRALALFCAGWPHRMAVIVIYWTKYVTLRIASPYITKRICEQECLHSERKVLSPDLKESEDTENFERNCQLCLRAISWIWDWTIISFTDTWTKEKTVNRLQKETL